VTAPADAARAPAVPRPRTFFGQPGQLFYLAFTEAWERFSFYGMTALLTLYLAQQLLLPGHVEHVAGFTAFRAGIESVFGPLSTLALASQIYGLYTGFVYFTPVFGGWIADRFIGRRNAVMLGAVLMSAGHLAMAFDQSFLLALALLVVGCGFLQGNISIRPATPTVARAALRSSRPPSMSAPSRARSLAASWRRHGVGTRASDSPVSLCCSALPPTSPATGICRKGRRSRR